MSKNEAMDKARKLTQKTYIPSAVWYGGEKTGWEYGIASSGLSWVEYLNDNTDSVK